MNAVTSPCIYFLVPLPCVNKHFKKSNKYIFAEVQQAFAICLPSYIKMAAGDCDYVQLALMILAKPLVDTALLA